MIRVNNLSISYGKNKVINDLSFLVDKGTINLIKGDNGAGKSTLCYALARIIPDNINSTVKGEIIINDKLISSLSRLELVTNVGIVLQNPDNMLFSPTVEDELAFAPENLCLPREDIRKRVDNAITLTNIEHLRYSSPSKLSGGEKLRVAIASVLTLNSNIIIFDEVLSCLDNQCRCSMIDLFLALREQGKTILIVEHSDCLDKYADSIITIGGNYDRD